MIKTLFKFIKISFKLKPKFYIILIFNALIKTFGLVLNIYSLKILIDALTNKVYIEALKIAAVFVVLNLLKYFLERVINKINTDNQHDLTERLDHLMAQKLAKTKYENLEDPYYLDLKERAKFANDNQGALYSLLKVITVYISSIVSIIGLIGLVISFDYKLLILVLVVFLLHLLVTLLNLKAQMAFYNEIMPINRKFGYYINELSNYENAKEYRFSKMNELLMKKETIFQNDINKFFFKNQKKWSTFSFLMECINYGQMALNYLYIGYKTITENLGLGTFSLYTTTIMKLSKEITSMIDYTVHLKRLSEYINPYITLLEIEDSKSSGNEVIDKIETIEFKNVWFKYPKTQNYILKDISFKINKHEKISIVGLNGAGKTSLVKLVTRLYEPTKGNIYINGKEIGNYNNEKLLAEMAVVFQDFQIFAYSINENIAVNDDNIEKVEKTLDSVGFTKYKDYSEGVMANYSKVYNENGVMLSGGELQKLAIARALYKNSSLTILDEPTAALDPLAEAEIYEHFNDLVKDSMAIYISHRMSSSVFCDKILVLNDGIIESFDSHKNLMKNKSGLYFKLFNTQAKNYQK